MGAGKWNVYDTDIRVPMRIVGPGVRAGARSPVVGSHVDLAPTWLGLAGLETPEDMDGRSLVPQIISTDAGAGTDTDIDAPVDEQPSLSLPLPLPLSVAAHLRRQQELPRTAGRPTPMRLPFNSAYIEYHGLGLTGAPGRLGDAFNNTFRALRVMDHQPGGLGNVLYAEWGDFFFERISFWEYYDLDDDEWQLRNGWGTLPEANKTAWKERIRAVFAVGRGE